MQDNVPVSNAEKDTDSDTDDTTSLIRALIFKSQLSVSEAAKAREPIGCDNTEKSRTEKTHKMYTNRTHTHTHTYTHTHIHTHTHTHTHTTSVYR